MSDDWSDPKSEAAMRAAKDEVLGRLADTSRKLGVLPPTREQEAFVAPILDKIVNRPEAPAKPSAKSPSAPKRPDGGGRVLREELGQAVFALDEGQVVGVDASKVRDPRKRPTFVARAARYAIAMMMRVPEWRAALVAAMRTETTPEKRAAKCRALVRAAYRDPRVGAVVVAEARRAGETRALEALNRIFGIELKAPDAKITVGGGK